ncbi:hypothetical protein L1887_17728 [Cichorium endivia]|nr:hypothetical protein L1887_17728 [Cichorium endivia]
MKYIGNCVLFLSTTNTAEIASCDAYKYIDRVSPGVGLASVGKLPSACLRFCQASSATTIHLNPSLLTSPFNILKSGRAFSAYFAMKRPNVVSFPFKPCISFNVTGGLVSRASYTLAGLGRMP